MKFIEIAKRRRSVRDFKERDEISNKDRNLILEAARWAPSAKNLQPIEYVIVKDGDVRKGLSAACHQNQPEKAPLNRIIIQGF